jgi:hypothetical protein
MILIWARVFESKEAHDLVKALLPVLRTTMSLDESVLTPSISPHPLTVGKSQRIGIVADKGFYRG